jgi:hypothetical protein
VQITPEVAVFARNRQLAYDGRIDDWWRFPEAKSQWERALQIDPNQPIPKDNLDALQKEQAPR